ncbi:MAG: hypothetical protein WA947_11220 [Phormidesmis sp.]
MSSTVFDLLERIQEKPGMYLGYPSVQSLFMFLNGYEFGRGEVGIELTADEEAFYDKFQPWLQRRLGIRSVSSWDKLIMLSCHDEKTGFERFFKLLSEFRQQKDPNNAGARGVFANEIVPLNDLPQNADSKKPLQTK